MREGALGMSTGLILIVIITLIQHGRIHIDLCFVIGFLQLLIGLLKDWKKGANSCQKITRAAAAASSSTL